MRAIFFYFSDLTGFTNEIDDNGELLIDIVEI